MSVYKLALVFVAVVVPVLLASLCYIDYMFRGVRTMNFALKFFLGSLDRLWFARGDTSRLQTTSHNSTSTKHIIRRFSRVKKSRAKSRAIKKKETIKRAKGKNREDSSI